MTVAGWCFLIVSWSLILGLLVFCLPRIMGQSTNDSTRPDGPPTSAP